MWFFEPKDLFHLELPLFLWYFLVGSALLLALERYVPWLRRVAWLARWFWSWAYWRPTKKWPMTVSVVSAKRITSGAGQLNLLEVGFRLVPHVSECRIEKCALEVPAVSKSFLPTQGDLRGQVISQSQSDRMQFEISDLKDMALPTPVKLVVTSRGHRCEGTSKVTK